MSKAKRRQNKIYTEAGWTHRLKGKRNYLLKQTSPWKERLLQAGLTPTPRVKVADFVDEDKRFRTLRDDQVVEL